MPTTAISIGSKGLLSERGVCSLQFSCLSMRPARSMALFADVLVKSADKAGIGSSSGLVELEKLVDSPWVGEADEVAAIRDNLIRPDTADRYQVVPGAVNMKYRAVRLRRDLPSQDHCHLSAQDRDRCVQGHLPNQLVGLPSGRLSPGEERTDRCNEMADDGVRKELRGPENGPVSGRNRRPTAATGDEQNTPAVASHSQFAGQHTAERDPAEDAGAAVQGQAGGDAIRISGKILIGQRRRQPGRLKNQAVLPLRGKETFVAGHAREQDEPVGTHNTHYSGGNGRLQSGLELPRAEHNNRVPSGPFREVRVCGKPASHKVRAAFRRSTAMLVLITRYRLLGHPSFCTMACTGGRSSFDNSRPPAGLCSGSLVQGLA